MNTQTVQTNGNGLAGIGEIEPSRLKRWPNGLGFSLETSKGEWDLMRVNGGAWHASYFPRGAFFASQHGSGDTMRAALGDALERPNLATCQSVEDVLADASIYEERYGHAMMTAVVTTMAAIEGGAR